MTQEEKAKAYDEALKVIKDNLDALNEVTETGAEGVNIQAIKNCFYRAFPELRKSEDERIRKELISFVRRQIECHDKPNVERDEKFESWIDWLENQSEQNSCNKVKPKFEVGDWITFYGGEPFKILKVEQEQNGILDYLLLRQNGHDFYYNKKYVDENARLWTIKDAKPGDVIYVPNGNNEYYFFIFKGIENAAVMSFASFYQYDDGTSKVEGTIDKLCSVNDVFQPATKEQCDFLFKETKKAGYEWNAEKKELKKIEQMPIWAEEDKKIIKRIDSLLYSINKSDFEDIHVWLKSIKDRVQPQNHWKPCDEQIKAIRLARSCIVDDFSEYKTLSDILIELEEQLQKIKEDKIMEINEIDKAQLEKNYADNLERLTNRYRSGAITEREYNSLLEWERKNFESGGRLYAEHLAKALTPNPKWFR